MSMHCFIERYIADLEMTRTLLATVRYKWQVDYCYTPDSPSSGDYENKCWCCYLQKFERGSLRSISSGDGGISNPETMEAIACREGLALASNILLQRFRLEWLCNVIRNIHGANMGVYGHHCSPKRPFSPFKHHVNVTRWYAVSV
jgi:hypothetical protein